MIKVDLNNVLGSLIVSAKLEIFDSNLKLYPRIMPDHKFEGSDTVHIGEIIINKEYFDKSDNGNLIKVCFFSKIFLKELLEEKKFWGIYSGDIQIGKLELNKVLKFEVIFS